MNRNMLKYEQFVATVTELLSSLHERDKGRSEAWEVFKEEVKLAAIERSSNIPFQLRARETQLQKDLKYFHKVESEILGTCFEDTQHIKRELDKIYHDRYSGADVRSQSEKFILEEQPTERALADEKRYALTKEIYEIDYKNK